jgi:hypothetical protein
LNNEVDINTAFHEIEQTVRVALQRCEEYKYPGSPALSHFWFAPARTFVYHTVAAIEGVDSNTLDDVAAVFYRANKLPSQPWYPAFIAGWSEPLDGALPDYASGAARGQARDLLRLREGRLEWHHIVTVAGPALLPPLADRLLMNTLRRLKLDHAERRTYLDEANALAAMTPDQWAKLRAQLDS